MDGMRKVYRLTRRLLGALAVPRGCSGPVERRGVVPLPTPPAKKRTGVAGQTASPRKMPSRQKYIVIPARDGGGVIPIDEPD